MGARVWKIWSPLWKLRNHRKGRLFPLLATFRNAGIAFTLSVDQLDRFSSRSNDMGSKVRLRIGRRSLPRSRHPLCSMDHIRVLHDFSFLPRLAACSPKDKRRASRAARHHPVHRLGQLVRLRRILAVPRTSGFACASLEPWVQRKGTWAVYTPASTGWTVPSTPGPVCMSPKPF